MAATTQQYSALDQLFARLGLGDSGTDSDLNTGMTVPTAYNTSSQWQPPSITGGTDTGNSSGFGLNVGTAGLALQGLGALGGLWGASQQNKLAKDQFKFQKEYANANLNNSIKSYNNSLEDKLTSRGAVEGRTTDYTAAEIARRQLTR